MSEWIRVDPENFVEGDAVWLQHKDCADTVTGTVILKSDDGWTFMLAGSDKVFSVIDWYIAKMQE